MIHPRTLQALEFGKITQYVADLCISAPGRKQALKLYPLSDRNSCAEAVQLYEEGVLWFAHNGGSSTPFVLSPFPDVSGILDLANNSSNYTESNKGMFDLDAFWAIREVLRQFQDARNRIINDNGNWPHLLALFTAEPFPDSLLAALNRCISDDGGLKDESSPELWRIRNELRNIHQNCLRKVNDFAQRYNMQQYLQDDFMTLASDRYVLPLKANFKGRMQGIIHDWSQTGETCYFEPIFLVEINNRLRELKREEREEERKILDYLATLLVEAINGVNLAFKLLGDIDFINAKRLMANYLNCNCITFSSPAEGIELLEARHPLLAMARQNIADDPKIQPVRPLNIILEPGDRTLIITGGNAGGKTVCLKCLGLISAMAMSGLPVPVSKGSHLPWFDRVDAFIGDEQSLAENVSTFTAQIDHLAKAWKHLDNQGLVLLDEFGSGTDPAEGAALAQAVLDGLLDKNCFTLCATHFPALKSYALTKSGVRAASMLFDAKTSQPLFKLAYGQVGSSQALVVAKEHGLPESILERARHYLLQDGEDSATIISKLNGLAVEREKEIAQLNSERKKVKIQLEEKRTKLDKEKERLQIEIRKEIERLMRAWKDEKATAKQTMKEMSRLRAGLIQKSQENSVLPVMQNLKLGQKVFHTGFNKRGAIIELDEKRKRARLDMDGVCLWADWKDLRESSEKSINKTVTSKISSSPATIVLDVRGQRSEEAIANAEKFLDKALLAGFDQVEIVHGRGTGALRREIHSYLRTNPSVEKVELAPEDRGGDGMSIVTLK